MYRCDTGNTYVARVPDVILKHNMKYVNVQSSNILDLI